MDLFEESFYTLKLRYFSTAISPQEIDISAVPPTFAPRDVLKLQT